MSAMGPDIADEELLSAYIDGELADADAWRIEARLQTEPALAKQLSARLSQGNLLRRAMEDCVGEEVPVRFLNVIMAHSPDAAGHRLKTAVTEPANDNISHWRLGGAVAASLVAGAVLGVQFAGWRGNVDPIETISQGLEITASGQTIQLASGDLLTPKSTFAKKRGGWCREFALVRAESSRSGLACRTNRWSVEALVPAVQQNSDGFAVAGDEEPQVIEQLTSNLRSGDPLDRAREEELLAARWKDAGTNR